jgi:mannose-6-phosphate isomerase class I
LLSIEKSNLWIANKWWKVISNEFFYVSEQLVHGEVVEQQSPESMSILYCISGALEITSETEKLSMTAGETIIISAGIGKYKLSGNAHIVRTMGA